MKLIKTIAEMQQFSKSASHHRQKIGVVQRIAPIHYLRSCVLRLGFVFSVTKKDGMFLAQTEIKASSLSRLKFNKKQCEGEWI